MATKRNPSQYNKMIRAVISVINSVEHAEDSLREYISRVKVNPKVVKTNKLSTHVMIDPNKYIAEQFEKAIIPIKEINSIIRQIHFDKKGVSSIEAKQYDLISHVNILYLLENKDQEEVFNLINTLYEKAKNGKANAQKKQSEQ